jgi:hypothetical protein
MPQGRGMNFILISGEARSRSLRETLTRRQERWEVLRTSRFGGESRGIGVIMDG